jgi:N-glycosylase/DNA lyase
LEQLSKDLPGMESRLRKLGFGYRAKFISQTVEKLAGEYGGIDWLYQLRNVDYAQAKQQLLTLCGGNCNTQ